MNPQRIHRRSAAIGPTLCLLACATPSIVLAQVTPAPTAKTTSATPAQLLAQAPGQAQVPPQAQAQVPTAVSTQPTTQQEARPSSTEQGQTPMDESFGARTHDEWVRETRRKAWEDTDFNVQLRSYYLDRDKYDDTKSAAWALGGSAGFKTGYFRERFSIGATAYTSQRAWGPEDEDGTLLLQPGQHGYTVLGELYGEYLFTPDVRMTVGARGFDTPYINRNDSRMTPNTFLAAAVQGLHKGGDESEWRWGAG